MRKGSIQSEPDMELFFDEDKVIAYFVTKEIGEILEEIAPTKESPAKHFPSVRWCG